MIFERKQAVEPNLSPKRALIIYGPRRVGKTTLLKKYLAKHADNKTFFATGDDMVVRQLFKSEDRAKLLDFAKPYDIIAIDEAQNISKIGLGTKIIIDEFPEKTIILTGSSSFSLAQEIGEPLTGRHFTMTLLPLAQSEIGANDFERQNSLADFLIYGAYPEVLLEADKAKKEKILRELVSSYLFKDILAIDRIKSPDLLFSIVKCLAWQVGQEVSLNEIARTVGADVKTVKRYVDVLEKMFVVKQIKGFSRNLRNEISKKSKYYFLDNGVRNAVISSFNGLDDRSDIGQLWENFVFMELLKKSNLADQADNFYFWRTHAGQEIDIIIESGGKLLAIECKWSPDKTIKPPAVWAKNYQSGFEVINRENYLKSL